MLQPKAEQFRARLLVAEDNPINLDIATRILENLGCEVIAADNGAIAALLLAQQQFDLVLMDCEMPVMDGFEASRRIRTLEARVGAGTEAGEAEPPRVPIVAVTAYGDFSVQEKCLQAGMDDFLVKPFDELHLAQALRRWLPGRERSAVDAGAPERPVIDTATIDKIRSIGGDASLLQRVIGKFLGTAPGLVAEIRARTEAGDAEAVWRAAHGLKSSAGAIGAQAVAERVLESAPRFASYATPAVVNGNAGVLVLREQRVLAVIGFTVVNDRIAAIDLVANQEKLRHIRRS